MGEGGSQIGECSVVLTAESGAVRREKEGKVWELVVERIHFRGSYWRSQGELEIRHCIPEFG